MQNDSVSIRPESSHNPNSEHKWKATGQFSPTNIGPWTLRHWFGGSELSRHFGTNALVARCLGAEVSSVRSVRNPNHKKRDKSKRSIRGVTCLSAIQELACR